MRSIVSDNSKQNALIRCNFSSSPLRIEKIPCEGRCESISACHAHICDSFTSECYDEQRTNIKYMNGKIAACAYDDNRSHALLCFVKCTLAANNKHSSICLSSPMRQNTIYFNVIFSDFFFVLFISNRSFVRMMCQSIGGVSKLKTPKNDSQ